MKADTGGHLGPRANAELLPVLVPEAVIIHSTIQVTSACNNTRGHSIDRRTTADRPSTSWINRGTLFYTLLAVARTHEKEREMRERRTPLSASKESPHS